MRIATFDTTLRDGTQGEAVSFSVNNKLLIVQMLDELGVDYVEGGWPGSNPRDREFFVRAGELSLRHIKVTAFGSTRLAKNPVHDDANVRALIEAQTPVVSVVGKSWTFHVERALGVTREQNLQLIGETVKYLKDAGKEVIYDAEHFFDGYRADPTYALKTLEAAIACGADVLCLCDTNGGSLAGPVAEAVAAVCGRFGKVVGIHTHNDCELAVANTIAAVEAGASHVQGCINGYGERCGNANLASVLANLELKLNHTTIGRENLSRLSSVCRQVAALAGLPMRNDQPFVGRSAFAHKGGLHVSAVLKDPATYEHICPEAVGNRQRVLVSDLSGRSNIAYKLRQNRLLDQVSESTSRELLERVKQMEYEGYELETCEGTFELLVREALHPGISFFEVESYEVSICADLTGAPHSTATVVLRARDHAYSATVMADGPLQALNECLRTCLSKPYPDLGGVELTNYNVRVLDGQRGASARVRVVLDWSDPCKTWSTVGVSDNVIDASWKALVDAIRLELMRLTFAEVPSQFVS